MFHLFKNPEWKKLLLTEGIPFLVAMMIAELFYKFGSFLLECCSFLITWYLFSWLAVSLTAWRRKPGNSKEAKN